MYSINFDIIYLDVWLIILIASSLQAVTTIALGIYQPQVLRDNRLYIIRLMMALITSLMMVVTLSFFLPGIEFWRSNLLAGYFGASLFIIIGRLFFKKLLSAEDFRMRVLVLGAGKQAQKILDYAKNEKGSALEFVAFILMPNDPEAVEGAVPYDDIDNLLVYAEQLKVEEIIVVPDERRGGLPMEDLVSCKMQGIRISDPVHLYERERGYVDLKSVQPSWLIYSEGFSGGKIYELMLKRIFDITVSIVFLIISAPIMLATALAVKLTSRGPIFYKQERVGREGKSIFLKKFRSMKIDAEADGTPQWAQKDDPRVTPIGKFIRKSRLDEMPQVLNVLMGDMSFVGPRPERPFFVDELSKEISYYKDRHCVKPGITGWAQLNYPYGASVEDARRKLEYDLYYIKNYSMFLDFLVVIQTVRVVLFPDGAR